MDGVLEVAASLLRAIHIAAGSVALVCFWVPLVVTKGNRKHRRVGRVYVWAMFVAAATAIAIAPIRMAERPVERWGYPLSLAYIAVLSFASAFYGVRVLGQEKRTGPNTSVVDLAVPTLLAVGAVGIFAYGVTTGFRLGLFFAPIGLLVAIPQLRSLRAAPSEKRWWLVDHLVSMIGSCIATVTAFLVVNAGRFLPGYTMLAWLTPTIVGVPLIAYWRRSFKAGRPVPALSPSDG